MNRRTLSARTRKRRAFTLMEVLLVLAILVILGSLVVMNFQNVFSSSQAKLAENQINSFKSPINFYMLDVGTYPNSQQGLQALITRPTDLSNPNRWKGPYIDKSELPKDPWENDYVYELMNGSQYRISSAGNDGTAGTEDDIEVVFGAAPQM